MTATPKPTRNYVLSARVRNVVAIILGLLATVLAPIITGLLAIILASRGIEGDRKVGIVAMAVAISVALSCRAVCHMPGWVAPRTRLRRSIAAFAGAIRSSPRCGLNTRSVRFFTNASFAVTTNDGGPGGWLAASRPASLAPK